MSTPYTSQTVALLTQHGKESLLAPVLEPALGCRIERVTGYGTDQLGTFTGEVARARSQLDTAKTKARIGMQLSGARIGLASEGAFIPDPYSGLMPWNVEVLVWLDDTLGIEVTGLAQGPAQSQQRTLDTWSELQSFAQAAVFPEHHLVLRPDDAQQPAWQKGIQDWRTLARAFDQCQAASRTGHVHVEHDLRAFCNPTRQHMIRRAAQDLLKKIQSACPSCHLPGFSITAHTAGRPCRSCGLPTRLPKSSIWQCLACQHQQEEASSEAFAEPAHCDACNP